MSRLTLEDVGRLAGVSRSTVSRVVNDEANVSADVRDRVLAVIDETGYGPNRAARSLASNRSDVLGLVIPSTVTHVFEDPYFGRLVRGITAGANRAGQTLALFLFEDPDEELEVYDRAVAGELVDGLVVTATRTGDRLAARLRRDGVPYVTVGRPDEPAAVHVDVDNRGGAHDATSHLLSHGRQRVAMVAAPLATTTGVDRHAGYRAALEDAGTAFDESLVAEGDYTRRGGEAAMRHLLSTAHPDAVFCASDTMALGALRAITAAGLRCPADVAVVGFDGLVDEDATTPSLTTVAQPVVETGRAAVELLLALLDEDDRPAGRHELATRLVTRRSCGCDPDAPPTT